MNYYIFKSSLIGASLFALSFVFNPSLQADDPDSLRETAAKVVARKLSDPTSSIDEFEVLGKTAPQEVSDLVASKLSDSSRGKLLGRLGQIEDISAYGPIIRGTFKHLHSSGLPLELTLESIETGDTFRIFGAHRDLGKDRIDLTNFFAHKAYATLKRDYFPNPPIQLELRGTSPSQLKYIEKLEPTSLKLNLDDTSSSTIADNLKTASKVALKAGIPIELSLSNIGDEDMQRLIEQPILEVVRVLTLRSSKLTIESLKTLDLSEYAHKLEKINLSANSFSEVEVLAITVASQLKNLREVDYSGLNLDEKKKKFMRKMLKVAAGC